MTNRLDQEITRRKATKATGARKGIRMIAPITKRTYTKGKATPDDKAKKAAYMRAYRAKMTTEQKENAQTRQNDRRKAVRKGQSYVYLPSIPQARDRRRSGSLLEKYYDQVTARLALSDAQLYDVAHSREEQDIDIALQIARRPQGIVHPWEMPHLERPPMPRNGYSRLPAINRSVKYVNKPCLTLADLQAK